MLQENILPEFLISMLVNQYGQSLTKKIIQGYDNKRFTTLRVNTLKATSKEIEQVLSKQNIEFQKVIWYEDAYIIKNVSEKEIKKLEIYEQGKIYLQSLSSMLPPLILKPKLRRRYFRYGSCSTEEKLLKWLL